MNKKTPWLLYICLFIFVAIFVAREIANITIPSAFVMIWFVGGILFLPRQGMLNAIFFIIPFAGGIPGYTILLSLIVLVIKSKRINGWQVIPPTIIALLELLSVASYDFDIRFQSVISYIGFVYLFFFILFDKDSSIDKRASVRYFCYGAVAALLLVYIPIIMNHGMFSLMAGGARAGSAMGFETEEEAAGHFVMNANTIAYYSITLLSILLLGKKRIMINSKVFYPLAIFVAIAAGVLSFSRTWLLLAGIVVILRLFNTKHRVAYIALAVVTFSVTITTQNMVVESISGVFQARMEDETFETGGGRFDIFKDYNRAWSENLKYIIVGTGASHYGRVIEHNFSMHNGLQQIWVCHGVLGFMLFFMAAIHYMSKYRNKKLLFVYMLPIFACFIFDQSIQFLNPYTLMLPFLPPLYILAFDKETESRSNVKTTSLS